MVGSFMVSGLLLAFDDALLDDPEECAHPFEMTKLAVAAGRLRNAVQRDRAQVVEEAAAAALAEDPRSDAVEGHLLGDGALGAVDRRDDQPVPGLAFLAHCSGWLGSVPGPC